jgi:acetolactate synthase-1/2/3 large subunit
MKLSDYIFEFIKSKGIDTVFTISGGGCMHLIDSLGKSGLKYVCNHHEQACAMAAEAYFRTSGKPGCVLVTTGPGGTNAITGVLCAYQDSIPMIVITGQVPTEQLSIYTGCRQIGQQEFDIVNTVKTMTKYAETILDKDDVKFHLETAWNECVNGRPGPVWLDIPLDVQASEVNVENLRPAHTIEQIDITLQLELLQNCLTNLPKSKPVVVIGNGIKSSGTINELKKFIEKYQLPVVSGPHSAVDIINYDYEYYAGKVGILGQKTSNQIIQEADLIISLGSRLNPKVIGYDTNKFAPKANKIVIDVDESELKKFDKNNSFIGINLNLKDFFNFIEKSEINFEISDWLNYVKSKRTEEKLVLDKHRELENYVSSYVFSEKLEEFLDDDSIIITSDGTAHVVLHKTVRLRSNQQLFSNEGTAPMGYGLPAAIGAYYGCNKPIICIEGDGSLMMNLQELQTVVHHKLPIKIFILNNDGYLSIKLTQNSFFKGNLVGSEPSSGVSIPSYEKIANAFGIKYNKISDNSQLDLLRNIFADNGPEIIEIMTDPWELHEPKVSAKGIDKNGKIIPGSLEDIK